MTRTLPDLLKQIKALLAQDRDIEAVCTSGLIVWKAPPYAKEAFDQIAECEGPCFPPAMEILLIPSVAVAAMVHAPMGAASGHPVPLGLISFDQDVLRRAEAYVLERVEQFRLQAHLNRRLVSALTRYPAPRVVGDVPSSN